MKDAMQVPVLIIVVVSAIYLASASVRNTADINTATQAQLERVPGIGPSLASRIILERNRRGGFRSMDDMLKIRGFGRCRLISLKAHFHVSEPDVPDGIAAERCSGVFQPYATGREIHNDQYSNHYRQTGPGPRAQDDGKRCQHRQFQSGPQRNAGGEREP